MIIVNKATRLSPFASIVLNNGQHNPFGDAIVKELSKALEDIRHMDHVRGVILKANGKSFCAGGDLEWMKRASSYTEKENIQDAMQLSEFLNNLSSLPLPTIAAVHGPAFGGGVGLISACDVAVSVRSAIFALSEVRLGLTPATISPYVVRRIGAGQARRYFLTGERFSADRALQIGLVHEVVDTVEEMNNKIIEIQKAITDSSPTAIKDSKELIAAVEGREITRDVMLDTAKRLAQRRAHPEAKEGISSFLERRKPSWVL